MEPRLIKTRPIMALPDGFYLCGQLVRRSPSKTGVNALMLRALIHRSGPQIAAAVGERERVEKRTAFDFEPPIA